MAVVQAPLGGTAQTDDEDQPAAAPVGGLGALAAGQFAGLSGPYQALYQQMQAKADAQRAAQQEYLASMQKQEDALSQTGMSDLDRASLMFQAAGALGQTTRSGGFGETLGNVATSLAGPLSKAAEAQRQRQTQLQQLQLARQKLGVEMAGTGGVDPAQALQLLKAQQEQEEEKPTPSEFERVIAQLTPEEKAKALRVKAGLETSPEKKEKVSDKTLSDFSESGATLADIDELTTRFKPEYAGKWLESGAEAQNLAGRKGILPGYKDQATWWSDYAERRNVARNTLFGSAVTKPEKEEFAKADISPGMDPDVIAQKLARQREIARTAAYKLAKAKELQGVDIAPIEAALGYKLTDLQKGAKPPVDSSQASSVQHPEAAAALAWAKANSNDPRAAAILQRLGAK